MKRHASERMAIFHIVTKIHDSGDLNKCIDFGDLDLIL